MIPAPPSVSHPPASITPGGIPAGRRLIRRLGAGAFGEVWEAEHDEGLVALKFLRTAHGDDSPLRRECKVLRELVHRNIVRFVELHIDDNGAATLEMECIRGTSLAALARDHGGMLTWDTLKPLALQLCDALAFAHARGVVHRDIKPSNLLLDESQILKLVDFGSAAITRWSQIHLTSTIEMGSSGTLPFMSPQQVNGTAPDPADDLYAVGATLHTLLTGAPPFCQGYLVHQVLHEKPPSIPDHQRELGHHNPVPAGIARVISSCLAKDPSGRPRSADHLRQLLDDPTRMGPSTRRRKMLLAIAGGGIALAAGSVPMFLRRRATRPPALEDGFSSMFDGETLDGWQGDPRTWRVVNGAITGRLDAPRMADASNWRKESLHWTAPVPDDFELRLQVFLALGEPDAGNLGVRYRISGGPPEVSYDLDFEPIWKYNCGLREIGGRDMLARPTQIVRFPAPEAGDTETPRPRLIGHLADEQRLRNAYRDGAWNDLLIRASGHRMVHQLNGVTMVDFTDEDAAARRLRGGLALKMLLYYGPWVEARFRHIRIREA
jgi:Protein kinase domain/Domain of Unknown Function (DUF1080)